jgi:hypothetical protein
MGSRSDTDSVNVNDEEIVRLRTDGVAERVRWDDLVQVNVRTTDCGPFLEDVYFELVGRNNTGCLVPQESEQFNILLARFREWPGWNSDEFGKAMCCTENARFICWNRTDPSCSS